MEFPVTMATKSEALINGRLKQLAVCLGITQKHWLPKVSAVNKRAELVQQPSPFCLKEHGDWHCTSVPLCPFIFATFEEPTIRPLLLI